MIEPIFYKVPEVSEPDEKVSKKNAVREKTHSITIVPQEHCMAIWKDARPLLMPAIERSHGRWTSDHLLAALATGQQQLWLAYDAQNKIEGVMTTQVVSYPNRRIMVFQFLGGTNFNSWVWDMLEITERYAAEVGCDGTEAVARHGFWPWLKQEGYERSYQIYEKTFGSDES